MKKSILIITCILIILAIGISFLMFYQEGVSDGYKKGKLDYSDWIFNEIWNYAHTENSFRLTNIEDGRRIILKELESTEGVKR